MGTPSHAILDSPLGTLLLAGDESGLASLSFTGARPPVDRARPAGPLAEAQRQLAAYCAGERREFDLALRPRGTPFQLRVWRELECIPYGTTITYAELARRIGNPGAARAVGAANGANPIAIVIPCHRVIGSGGELIGYAGGLHLKRRLLALEQAALVA